MKEDEAYLTISEAAEKVGVEPSVLRFWEKKFSKLNPTKKKGGRRFYSPDDMNLLEDIRFLLYDKKLKAEGAEQILLSDDKEAVFQEKRLHDFIRETEDLKLYVDKILNSTSDKKIL